MTRVDVVEATGEALLAAEAQAAHLGRLRTRLARKFPVVASIDRPDADIERFYALLHMFEQLYDVIARRLFRGAIALVDEDPAGLSAKELASRLEQLGAIDSRLGWLAISEVRNMLVHDYPLTPDALASHVNLANASSDQLVATLERIAAFLRMQDLFS